MPSLGICPNLTIPLALTGPAGPDKKAINLAGRHFKKGVDYYNLENFANAFDEFKKSYDLSKRPNTLYNIGQCLGRLGRLEEAIEVFERFLKDRTKLADSAAEAQELKTVHDYITEFQEILLAEKKEAKREAKDKYIPPRPQAAPTLPPPSSPAPSGLVTKTAPPLSRYRTWKWASLAAAVASSAVGAGFLLAAREKQQAYLTLENSLERDGQLDGGHFVDGEAQQTYGPRLNTLKKEMRRENVIGDVALGVGAALLATSATLFWLDRKRGKKVNVQPILGNQLGLGLTIFY